MLGKITDAQSAVIAAVITGMFVCIAAAVGLGYPIIEKWSESQFNNAPPSKTTTEAQVLSELETPHTQDSQTSSTTPLCPTTVSRDLVEEWGQVGETTKDDTLTYINEFDEMRIGGEFEPQDVLPAGVLIITDFGDGESLIYRQYPVRPIVHYRSWGVFETTDEYTAVQYGACMSIAPSD